MNTTQPVRKIVATASVSSTDSKGKGLEMGIAADEGSGHIEDHLLSDRWSRIRAAPISGKGLTLSDDSEDLGRAVPSMRMRAPSLRPAAVADYVAEPEATMATSTAKPWTPAQERMGTIVIRYMSRANKWLYRLTGGWLGGTFFGVPVMFLTTVGRKSGEPRTVPLLCLAEGDTLATVASKGGMSHHPMWYRNLAANPAVEVEFQGRKRAMIAHTATPDEKRVWWPKLCAMYPDYADYQARTERDIPVVVLTPRAS